ncbi:MAG TPA: WhiB family transcriptional regulator [Streptosporangiaceae bacterium]|nr:WhiB family transcriptional regulator [Streptosporangiaceae bacterium]
MVSPPAVERAGRSGSVDPALDVHGLFAEEPSWARLIRHARCADSGLDPDQWFPVSTDAAHARQEASAALAICRSCPVRASCLAVSLRHWDLGQHGIWGGLVAAERVQLRRRIAAGDRGSGRTLVQVMAPLSAR